MLQNLSRILCLILCVTSITAMAYSKNVESWQIAIYACFLNVPALMVLFPQQISAMFFGADENNDEIEGERDDLREAKSKSAGLSRDGLPQLAKWGWVLLAVLLIINHVLRR